jgi:hypothetical protein
MPHQTFKLNPGVNTNETPVLNQASVAECNLIRFKPDPQLGALVEKLGGWKPYGNLPYMPSIPRSMWAWEDLDVNGWLAIGMQSNPMPSGPAALTAYSPTGGTPPGTPITYNVTPGFIETNPGVNFATTAGSPIVAIADPTTAAGYPSGLLLSPNDAVYITEHVAIGGIILYGTYAISAVLGSGHYQIIAHDILGNPQPAVTTVAAPGGVVPKLTSTTSSAVISVHLPAHGFTVNSIFTVLIPTVVGDLTVYGDYDIITVTGVDDFTIQANITTAAGTSVFINGGNVRLLYNKSSPPGGTLIGYGVGPYGAKGYGTGQAVSVYLGTPVNARDWALDNWGETLLANPEGAVIDSVGVSGIFQWTPNSGMGVATLIPQAPPVNDGFFVAMPQRQIVAWGSTFSGIQDPLLIRWCDVNDYTTWVGTVVNQAGSYRLPKGSKIVAGLQSSQQAIIWTDLAVWTMQYISQPYIYSFNEVSTGCGLIAQKAAGTLFGVAYWMSQSQFFKMDGGGVAPIQCPVWDVIFQNLDPNNLDKIRFAPNSQFGEVAWHFPSKNGNGENDSYVKYHTILGVWDYSLAPLNPPPANALPSGLARSSWINQSVLGPPLAAGPDPITGQIYIYQHEVGTDAGNYPMSSWFRSGFFALSDADVKTFIDEVWPDMKWGYYGGSQSATVSISFNVKNYPSQNPIQIGPFGLRQGIDFISPRVRGRLVQIQLVSNDVGSFWRMGGMRYRGSPDGRY